MRFLGSTSVAVAAILLATGLSCSTSAESPGRTAELEATVVYYTFGKLTGKSKTALYRISLDFVGDPYAGKPVVTYFGIEEGRLEPQIPDPVTSKSLLALEGNVRGYSYKERFAWVEFKEFPNLDDSEWSAALEYEAEKTKIISVLFEIAERDKPRFHSLGLKRIVEGKPMMWK